MMPSSWTRPVERRGSRRPMPYSQAVDSRVLLTRLRATLAEPGGGQERLDRIVRLVADGLVAEVCSVYLRRDGTARALRHRGAEPESVHLSRLRVGQGLVGQIADTAEPINTRDASHTRGFRYLPETGEEVFSSFLGVPIQRLGEVLGVLVVQNREPREYTDDEVYALEVVAMVIAEMAELGAFVGPGAMEIARPHKLPFFVPRPRRPGGRGRGHRGAARAADRRLRPDQRRPDARTRSAARRHRGAARRGRRDARRRLPDRVRRAPRRAERLPDVRPRQGLGAADGGLDRQRPRRRGRRREGAVGDPRPHEPRPPTPICASGCTTSTTCRTACCGCSPAATSATAASFPTTRSSSPATSARASCSTTAASCAASCSRRARSAATRRSSPARWRSRWSSTPRASPARR